MTIRVGAVYKHFKGTLYRVERLTRDSETLEERVVYSSLDADPSDPPWDRPRRMWDEPVLWPNGVLQARFMPEEETR